MRSIECDMLYQFAFQGGEHAFTHRIATIAADHSF